MKSRIPIFTLELVVFPKSKYSLHIFEDRYKKMIEKCLLENSGFGIVTKINGEISKIGSYVTISEILEEFSSGEKDIVVYGVNRFYIQNIDVHTDGYYTADVMKFDDLNSDIDSYLIKKVQSKFKEIIEKVNFHLEESFWKNYSDTSNKSFKLAEKSGLNIIQQQELLNLQDENKRLNLLMEHLEKLDKKIVEGAALRNIVINNGYINE